MSSPNALERATMGGPILRHGPNISHNRLGNTFRHHLAKNCPKTRPPARTPGCIPRAPSGSDRWDFFNRNRKGGHLGGRATEGQPEGRDERDRASQIAQISTNGERLRRRILFSVLFVFFVRLVLQKKTNLALASWYGFPVYRWVFLL